MIMRYTFVLNDFFFMMLWGHRASDIHPSFVLGLRAIIICKKNNGDHGNPENHAKDNSVLG